jgi:hypothetical protein
MRLSPAAANKSGISGMLTNFASFASLALSSEESDIAPSFQLICVNANKWLLS